jgi:F0F1-type ATP synthase beta subunit
MKFWKETELLCGCGVVVDAEFPSGDLPSINNALVIQTDDGAELVVEVQEHTNPRTVRTIAMSSTAGLRRGLTVLDTAGRSRRRWADPPGTDVQRVGAAIDELPAPQARTGGPFTSRRRRCAISVSSPARSSRHQSH